MEFILASSNANKISELNELLGGVNIVAPEEKLDIEETGSTFHENALLKAKSYYEKYKKPTVSDDSGLVVIALPDELGVRSARFAPEHPEYSDKCRILIEKLSEKTTREAYFVCVLCFYINPKEYYFFEGRLIGEISDTAAGDTGFGYDPVFAAEGLKNQTLAQNSEWKMKNSHRSKACGHAQRFFSERLSK